MLFPIISTALANALWNPGSERIAMATHTISNAKSAFNSAAAAAAEIEIVIASFPDAST